jgi:hypothetical protein
MMKKLAMSGLKVTATKEGRKMAKEAFRKVFRKFKQEKKRAKKVGTPVVPYNLVKADLKKKIAGTKLTVKADIKAKPGLRRRILLRIEKAKRSKPKNKPIIFGKAYASDRAGRTMQIQPLTRQQRKLMLKEMAVSADKGYKQVRKRKYGYNAGGDVATLKTVAKKLSKASKAHKGQSQKLRKIISKYV